MLPAVKIMSTNGTAVPASALWEHRQSLPTFFFNPLDRQTGNYLVFLIVSGPFLKDGLTYTGTSTSSPGSSHTRAPRSTQNWIWIWIGDTGNTRSSWIVHGMNARRQFSMSKYLKRISFIELSRKKGKLKKTFSTICTAIMSETPLNSSSFTVLMFKTKIYSIWHKYSVSRSIRTQKWDCCELVFGVLRSYTASMSPQDWAKITSRSEIHLDWFKNL